MWLRATEKKKKKHRVNIYVFNLFVEYMIIWHDTFITKHHVEYVCNATTQPHKINNETSPMQSVYDNKSIYILFILCGCEQPPKPCQRTEKLYPYHTNDIRPAVRPAAKWNTQFSCCHQKSLSSCSHTFYHLCRDISCAGDIVCLCICGLCRVFSKSQIKKKTSHEKRMEIFQAPDNALGYLLSHISKWKMNFSFI